MSIHLSESLAEGRGIHVKHFGCFTFEPHPVTTSDNQSSMKLKACFVSSPELKNKLGSSMKDPLVHPVEGSIYQQGIRVSYLNPVPIASGCFFSSDFVRHTLDVIFKAVLDLIMRGYNLDLDFEELGSVCIFEKKIRTKFGPLIMSRATEIAASWPLKCINSSLSALNSNLSESTISKVHAIRTATRRPSKLDSLQIPDASRLQNMSLKIKQLEEGSKNFSHLTY